VVKTVDLILEGKAQGKPQKHSDELKLAPKIFKETCRIDWNKSTGELYNFVRGLSPYPAAWTEITSPSGELLQIKIFETKEERHAHNQTPGKLLTDNKSFVKITTPDGYLNLLSLQLPGKKRMSVEELLRGYKF
jgi:methionyl-tRNA formyltransferase